MKKTFRSILSCLLSLVLVLGTTTVVFAQEEDTDTPVVVISDIKYNPLVRDNEVIFNLADYQAQLYFTKPFTDDILSVFTKENLKDFMKEDGTFDFLGCAMSALNVVNVTEDAMNLAGQALNIYNSISEKIDFSDIKNIDFEQLKLLVKEYVDGAKAEYELFKEKCNTISLNADGTVTDDTVNAGSYDESLADAYDDFKALRISSLTQGICDNIVEENTYLFLYDWRLSPVDNAEMLNDFVKNVKSQSGAEAVAMISEGYGSTIACTYLSKYLTNAKEDVKNFITVGSEFMGTTLFGDIYTGSLINVSSSTTIQEKTSAVIRYLNDISDSPLTTFLVWLSNYILNRTHISQELVTIFQNELYNLANSLLFGLCRNIFANSAGLWALIPEESFENAVNYMYGSEESIAPQLYSKLESFNSIQQNAEETITNAKENGINVAVIATWDLQVLPIGINSSIQSDGYVDTAKASFGAKCVAINDVKSAIKNTQEQDFNHDHLSDSFDMLTAEYSLAGIAHYIDASTCALPENTWFIKNMKHNSFNGESNSFNFIMWLINADEQRTVWDNGDYQQFMNLNRYIGIGGTLDSSSSTGEHGRFLLGDINLDGKITAEDSMLCDMIINGDVEYEFGSLPLKNADVNGDGTIDSTDSDIILQISAGIFEEMTSGAKLEKPEKNKKLEDSQSTVRATVDYNKGTDKAEINIILDNPASEMAGSFVLDLNTDAFGGFNSLTVYEADDCTVFAGVPDFDLSKFACAFKLKNVSEESITLATFTVDLYGYIKEDVTASIYALTLSEMGTQVNCDGNDATAPKAEFAFVGDADGNHKRQMKDPRTILRYVAKLENDICFDSADMNGDGKITSKDARVFLRCYAALDVFNNYIKGNADYCFEIG